MNYQEFLEYIKENLIDFTIELEGEKEENNQEDRKVYEVDIHKVIKNNGIELDGLTIRKKGEQVSPNIYLNSYFESYQMGKPIAAIMEEIVYQYRKAKEENMLTIADVMNFSAVKNRIIIRLVNYEKNKEQLRKCPHKKFLNLAVTFRYIANKDQLGIASSLISNVEFQAWNVELEELYQIALFNTMKEFPWKMDSLNKVIAECLRSRPKTTIPEEIIEDIEGLEEKENGVNMFVLTNSTGINGATCILYDNVIKHFAKVQEANVFILPSSIHEVMLVPENELTDAAFLADLVVEANNSAVGLIDLLSDSIYYYDREKEQICIYSK